MATSESDADFESADEELGRGAPVRRDTRVTTYRTTVDSESDDDTEYVQRVPCGGTNWQRSETFRMTPDRLRGRKSSVDDKNDKTDSDVKVEIARPTKSVSRVKKTDTREVAPPVESGKSTQSLSTSVTSAKNKDVESAVESGRIVASDAMSKVTAKTELGSKEFPQTKQRHGTSRQLDAKKLGTKLPKDNVDESRVANVAVEDKRSVKCSNEKSVLSASKGKECKPEEKSKAQVARKPRTKLAKDVDESLVADVAMKQEDNRSVMCSNEKSLLSASKDKECKPEEKSKTQVARKPGTKIAKDVDESLVADVAMKQEDNRSVMCSNEKSLLSASKDKECKPEAKSKTQVAGNQSKSSSDLSEMDMPEELKSNKKFKEVFQPEGWEGLGDDVELPDELTEEKLQPVLQRLSLADKEGKAEGSLGSWGSWGNWDVTSLINASVSTLTSHVSQGITLLEGTLGAQDPAELEKIKQDAVPATEPEVQPEIQKEESQSYSSFGFGNLMSGVSSITKLVESTGSKVMTGGLDTLEAIGKKTMEVLQEGDPGLKKKRAFFMNEPEKPNLSQILREAKEKAETEEKTIEERELARRVHFESLFDDYQGLVHLEALEMLSKQSNMKIQQYLIELDTNDLTSVQETLEEIKEFCDLGDEDDEDKDNKDLKNRLENACHELGVDITYEKLYSVWTETENYLASFSTRTNQEIFQNAISTLAQFTAFSVERFHKTAELLLIKERRSTVNEADALVQLTNILSDQISLMANSFCSTLNKFTETAEKPDTINANITTIFLEATNANSYIQDAFRLLIPILQVGAI